MDPSINNYNVGKTMIWTVNDKECELSNKLKNQIEEIPRKQNILT